MFKFMISFPKMATLRSAVYLLIVLQLALAIDGKCQPKIEEIEKNSGFDVGSSAIIDCKFTDCESMLILRFEAKPFSANWMTIYTYRSDTGSKIAPIPGYNYAMFAQVHFLEIQNLTIDHHGEFKCVFIDRRKRSYESNLIKINVHVIPTEIQIQPATATLVANKINPFTCQGEGIHPEPDVVWSINGVDHGTGTANNTQSEDGLWSVTNYKALKFESIGYNVLSCIMETNTKKQWIQENITLDIKEPATVLTPIENITVQTNHTSPFTLTCRGRGHKPAIAWAKDGEAIKADTTGYIIQPFCDDRTCNSSLTSVPEEELKECGNSGKYEGVYICIITLKPPYESTQTSTEMKIEGNPCQTSSLNKNLSIIVPLIVILVVLLTSAVFLYKKKREQCITMVDALKFKHHSIPQEEPETRLQMEHPKDDSRMFEEEEKPALESEFERLISKYSDFDMASPLRQLLEKMTQTQRQATLRKMVALFPEDFEAIGVKSVYQSHQPEIPESTPLTVHLPPVRGDGYPSLVLRDLPTEVLANIEDDVVQARDANKCDLMPQMSTKCTSEGEVDLGNTTDCQPDSDMITGY